MPQPGVCASVRIGPGRRRSVLRAPQWHRVVAGRPRTLADERDPPPRVVVASGEAPCLQGTGEFRGASRSEPRQTRMQQNQRRASSSSTKRRPEWQPTP
jgi:hypothetical protein